VIIPISEHRLIRIYADIRHVSSDVAEAGKTVVIGQILRELVGIWTGPIGDIVMDSMGSLWLDRSTLDRTVDMADREKVYLARSMASFQRVAELNCAASKLVFLPRSQQWIYHDADAGFRDWVRANDSKCLDDFASYWNELQRKEF
jgi:hypothetical protein